MKWLKRLGLLVVFLAILAGALAVTGWWLSRRAPDWYTVSPADPQRSAAAAHRAEQEMQRTLSWAQDQQAYATRSRLGDPTSRPAKTLQIALTQEELNGFFQKWDSTFGWSRRYKDYLADPQIVLHDGMLILAATVKDLGTVLSIEFQPRIEQGKLRLSVVQVLAGRLPLPQSVWDPYRQKLGSAVEEQLPDWQSGAQISSAGAANTDAVAAGMGELLLNVLDNEPAKPVLFLPYQIGDNPKSLPVRMSDVRIANQKLTLTVEPMTSEQDQNLLEAIRAPLPPRPRVASANGQQAAIAP